MAGLANARLRLVSIMHAAASSTARSSSSSLLCSRLRTPLSRPSSYLKCSNKACAYPTHPHWLACQIGSLISFHSILPFQHDVLQQLVNSPVIIDLNSLILLLRHLPLDNPSPPSIVNPSLTLPTSMPRTDQDKNSNLHAQMNKLRNTFEDCCRVWRCRIRSSKG